jgi:hypothetical protein
MIPVAVKKEETSLGKMWRKGREREGLGGRREGCPG